MPTEFKHIRIEFSGGFWCGKTLDSRSPVPQEAELANGYYLMNEQGTIAGLFDRLSMAAVRLIRMRGWSVNEMNQAGFDGRHAYALVERIEYEVEIVLRFRYCAVREHC